MIMIRKMSKEDVPILYKMALRAFASDYDQFGVYPPMINTKKKRFLPPRIFAIFFWIRFINIRIMEGKLFK